MIEKSVDQSVEPNPSTISMKGKSAVDGISLISAFFTILTLMKDSMEVVSFMLQHVLLSVLISAALITVFSIGLAPRVGASIGTILVEISGHLKQLLKVNFGRKVFSLSRRIIVLGALVLVLLALVKVYISGVYYILLESGRDEGLVAARVAELNSVLAQRGGDLQVELTPPLGSSKYYAITIGPIFDQSKAADLFARLQEILGNEMRRDAGVKKITLRNLWRKAAGLFGTVS